ncbi:Late embryogenesis abundant [Hirschfeldia incana]|nr:Late embryogenesis abundant [Hirschfeldia incana]
MSELLPPPPPPPKRASSSSGFADPALAFPEFATKQHVLEKVQEEEGEGEDSSYGKGSFDLSSRSFSSPSISRNNYDYLDTPTTKAPSFKLPPSGLRASSSSRIRHEEETDRSRNSGSFVERIGEEEKRDWSGCFRKCCACTFMFVSILLIIVLLTGLSVNSSLHSRLPQVSVTTLKFSRLDITDSATDLLLNANVKTVLELSNKNDQPTLYYSPMKASVSSENINLGQKKLLGFTQSPGNVTYLNIATRIRKSKVYDVDATLLRNKEKNHEAVVKVLVSGKLGFDWLGFRVRLPIVIACEDVKESDVINGLKPMCDVRIFSQ